VLLLLDFWPLDRLQSRTRWRLLWEKIPFLCLAMVSCVATYMAQGKGHSVSMGLLLGPRVANAIASYLKYLSKTFWPANLSVFYPHPDLRYPLSTQWPDWQILAAALLLVVVSAFALLRHKRQPWFVTGWFWYLGTLVPVIGFIQVGKQGMADRYTYIPLIGVFVCFAWGANHLLAGLRSGKAVLATAGILVTTACVLATQKQVKYWRNDFTLFEHALSVNPNNPVANHLIGADLQEQRKYDLALTHFRAAVEYDPTFVDAYCSLGFTLYAMGRADEAIEQSQTAISLNPWHAQAHTSLGALLWMRGQRDEAVRHYAEALRLRPDLAMAHYNMGIALSALGRFSEAAAQLSEAVRLKPDYPEARALLSEVLAKQSKLGGN
jgi:Tfp pilus assembly protein PilF